MAGESGTGGLSRGSLYFWLVLFAVAFACVEASVVVYLRALYYPEGFSFPLKPMSAPNAATEIVRECATLVMLAAAGWLAGRKRWERFAFFMIAFGVWDIFYYVWLKILVNWPASLLEYDVLFLLPFPWIGPVIAPVLVSLALIGSGALIVSRFSRGGGFKPSVMSWVFGGIGVGFLLFSFLRDTGAALEGKIPLPYRYDCLMVGLFACGAALARAVWSRSSGPSS
jgi:hypothetical protein